VYYDVTEHIRGGERTMAKTKIKVIMEKSSAGGSGGCGAYIPGGESMDERRNAVSLIR